MIYKLITFKLPFRSIFRLFLFLWPQIKIKCENQKSENLLVLYISNCLSTIYPGWDLALEMPRPWL